ncbi:MAG: NACHT domain-containing protein [Chloroflexota bacterium]
MGNIDNSIAVATGEVVDMTVTINQYIDPNNVRNQRYHKVLRQAVNQFWIKGVLKSSLYREVRIRLKLDEQPHAVDNQPWDLILQRPNQPDRTIGDHQQILNVYDEMGEQLLILGSPGSGKTTTLLMLAESLLARADADPTHPTPIVVNLSSWQSGQPLADWLVEELNQRYQMPKKVSQGWVANDELIPLLDGLDEVDEDRREECVAAINDYRREHVVNIVVCSRTEEYEALTDKLQLQGAVVVRPLTQVQIDQYIADLGEHGKTLAHVLAGDTELRELAQTPLMLSVMTLAVQGDDPLSNDPERTTTQRLFNRYIKRMFQHRELEHKYSQADTLHWLQWLASQMVKRSQTFFYIEYLQPDWLGDRSRMNVYRLSLGLITGLSFGLMATGLSFRLITGLIEGLVTGVYFTLISALVARNILKEDSQRSLMRDKLLKRVKSNEERIASINNKLNFKLNELLKDVKSGEERLASINNEPNFKLDEPLKNVKSDEERLASIKNELNFKLGELLKDVKSDEEKFASIKSELSFKLGEIPVYKEIDFTNRNGMIQWLIIGLMGGLIIEQWPARAKSKTKPNQGIWALLRNCMILGLIAGLTGGLVFGLMEGLALSLMEGLTDKQLEGRSFRLTGGLNFSLAGGGLSFVMIAGLGGLTTCLKHFILRFLLFYHSLTPWNYARFLDYTSERLFLRKVGGGYVFMHRMVLEHFAALTEKDIQLIVEN